MSDISQHIEKSGEMDSVRALAAYLAPKEMTYDVAFSNVFGKCKFIALIGFAIIVIGVFVFGLFKLFSTGLSGDDAWLFIFGLIILLPELAFVFFKSASNLHLIPKL